MSSSKSAKPVTSFSKKEKEKRKNKEKRQCGVSCSQIKTTFGNLLKEAYLHLYGDWVGRKKKIRLLLQPLNCQISLEISHSYISRVNSVPFVAKSQPLVPLEQVLQRKQLPPGNGISQGSHPDY